MAGAALDTDGVEQSQNALVRGPHLCPQLPFLKEVSHNCFLFDFVKGKIEEVSELPRFLMLPRSKIEEVSQNCRVFLMLPRSKIEEVTQNRLVFKIAGRQIDRQTDRQTDR